MTGPGTACDWCDTAHDTAAADAATWLMGLLRHTAGAATDSPARHDVNRSGRLLRACATCAPLVRAHDVDGLLARARAVEQERTGTSRLSRVEHGLIFRAIDRALASEVTDPTARPSRAQREAWALASARANAEALSDLDPSGAAGKAR